MAHYEANTHLTRVGVMMGDHAQDVVRALNLPRWKTVGSLLDEFLGDDQETYITIRSVKVGGRMYDVDYEAFENACSEQAPQILDEVAVWPHGYDEQGADLVRDIVRSTLTSAGLSVEPGAPPTPKDVAF